MCGIAGIVPLQSFASRDAARILERLAPRGPDDQGWVVLAPGGALRGDALDEDTSWSHPVLLHRRLSILDLTPAGHQPMSSPDGRLHIVYNGEVYNFRELRTELEARGHVFESDSDTEVVLTAYTEWGRAMLDRLVGMFAIAIFDLDRNTLFLARDHFGVKPFYHTSGSWGFAFASTIPALLEVPGVSRSADPTRVKRYLTTSSGISSYGRDTMFADIKQVPAGHWAEVDLATAGAGEPQPYWRITDIGQRRVTYDEAVAEVRRLFLDSVRLQLRSDVPVGAALSGGIDSSSIVSAARHLLGPDIPIHTFSYIADDPKVSEAHWIEVMEEAMDTRGHGVRPNVAALTQDLEPLIQAQGEPFGSTSIYAQYCVFRAARAAGIPVVLDGQGADEILAGYRGYYPPRIAGLIRRGRLLAAWQAYRRISREPGVKATNLRTETIAHALPQHAVRILQRLRNGPPQTADTWIDDAWFDARARPETTAQSGGLNPLHASLVSSITDNSLPHLLRYADRNSMAHSVESRVPFLDHRLVSYILSLPDDYIIGRDATTKRVLRDAMRGLVPDTILDRRDKIGFQTTERDWMIANDTWVRSTLDSDTAHRIPFLRPERMLQTWEDVKAGKMAYSWTIWRWINLIEWTRLLDVRYEIGDDPERAPHAIETPVLEPATMPPYAAAGLTNPDLHGPAGDGPVPAA